MSSNLIRYGVRWKGAKEPICTPMDDGYWTPWHLAQAEIDALKSERDALLTDLSAATEVGDQATPADIVGVVKAMWEELRCLLKQADALKAQNAELLAAQEGTPCKHEFNAVLGGVLSCIHCYASFSDQQKTGEKS